MGFNLLLDVSFSATVNQSRGAVQFPSLPEDAIFGNDNARADAGSPWGVYLDSGTTSLIHEHAARGGKMVDCRILQAPTY